MNCTKHHNLTPAPLHLWCAWGSPDSAMVIYHDETHQPFSFTVLIYAHYLLCNISQRQQLCNCYCCGRQKNSIVTQWNHLDRVPSRLQEVHDEFLCSFRTLWENLRPDSKTCNDTGISFPQTSVCVKYIHERLKKHIVLWFIHYREFLPHILCVCNPQPLLFAMVTHKDLQCYKIQHNYVNKLRLQSPSWNLFLCTPSILLFRWPTVNTLMYGVLSTTLHTVSFVFSLSTRILRTVFSRAREEQVILNNKKKTNKSHMSIILFSSPKEKHPITGKQPTHHFLTNTYQLTCCFSPIQLKTMPAHKTH